MVNLSKFLVVMGITVLLTALLFSVTGNPTNYYFHPYNAITVTDTDN